MKNKKAIIGLGALAVMLFGVASSIAYLTDTDTTVNVMTVGNVKIEQLEYERVLDENGKATSELQPYSQLKPIVPAVYKTENKNAAWADGYQTWESVGAPGSNQLFHEGVKNVIDKFVFVENTGKKDAYYRTIIAIEAPEGLSDGALHTSLNGTNYFDYNADEDGVQNAAYSNKFYTTINGTRYLVYTATYTKTLTPGEISRPSFLQVFLDPKTTNEDVELFGDTFEILAISQAVQTDGFDNANEALEEAFGKVNEAKVSEWFGGVELEVSAWTGGIDTTWYNNTDKEFTLTNADQLAGLSKLVNEGNNFSGKTIKLASDINLNNKKWSPIGNSSNKFQGTFDGGNNTISNLNVGTSTQSYVGLFGFTTNGEIKNITIENATVKGYLGVGVVAGSPYTSKYNNITVTGLVKVDGFAYVGTVGGRNVYANWDNITVNVSNGSYVKANSVENGIAYRTYVGGVVGFMGEGGHTMSNVQSNIDVYGSTIDVGGIVGIAHYGNSFINCSSSGNVTITDATEENDALEIGGIAGVWNDGGSNVTFTNCQFTGNLSSNIPVTYKNGGLVGNAYSQTENNLSKLIIN